ncbi:phosphodiester glycosidase family protein [Defluviimonas aestuarii]|uniref:phosphodiester glycosidase family protein n=1 Tax=Albidovulum aestuarii TaxID=1130726 RepID=UPI003AFFED38
MIRISAKAGLALLLLAGNPRAETCRDMKFETQSYAICDVTFGADLQLFLTGSDERPMGTFDRLRDQVEGGGKSLIFAMNAGMYHSDRSPVGLYVERAQEKAPIVTREGPGNFGLLPNGVFCISENGFTVAETRAFAARSPDCAFATQSGPMLVIDGALHPRFLPDSDSRYVRNGVGVSIDGQRAVFAISDAPVSFHEFARLFRDGLDLPNALYFDGKVSRLYAPEIGRDDIGFPMGPMVGLVAPGR